MRLPCCAACGEPLDVADAGAVVHDLSPLPGWGPGRVRLGWHGPCLAGEDAGVRRLLALRDGPEGDEPILDRLAGLATLVRNRGPVRAIRDRELTEVVGLRRPGGRR